MTYPKEMNIKMMYYSYHRGDDTDIQGMLRILCIVCMKFLLWQDHFHLNRSMDIWQVASSRMMYPQVKNIKKISSSYHLYDDINVRGILMIHSIKCDTKYYVYEILASASSYRIF